MALNVDTWALHEITLDRADRVVGGTLVANGADAHGRGIYLTVTDNGESADMSGMTVSLLWRNDQTGRQGSTDFEAVDASAGKFKVYYPAGMSDEGNVTARISIYAGGEVITGSRNFRIHVERNPVDEDAAMADDDFSAFVQATIDLRELESDLEGAEALRATAESGRVTEHAALKAESQAATATALAAAQDARDAAAEARGAVSPDMQIYLEWWEDEDGDEILTIVDTSV